MMQHHKPATKGSLLAALDIGSSKVACLIGRVSDDEGSLEVLGVGISRPKELKTVPLLT
ncbi:MAG: hypothetical protein LRZ85_06030 [Alphaproteobacteria bacterium]|nr:hypothetical protein [Alphaproteobacteria bacterium]